jgi:hypothetical protein
MTGMCGCDGLSPFCKLEEVSNLSDHPSPWGWQERVLPGPSSHAFIWTSREPDAALYVDITSAPGSDIMVTGRPSNEISSHAFCREEDCREHDSGRVQ